MSQQTISLSSGRVVWTASVSSWAMSRYINCPVRECAGSIGAAENGVFHRSTSQRLEGYVRTGFLSVEGITKLRTQYIYVYSKHSENLSIEIYGNVGKQFQLATYDNVIHPSGSFHQARYAQIGRGYSTNYLQVGVLGKFMLRQIMLAVDQSYRRV